jgi:hypothetical protein
MPLSESSMAGRLVVTAITGTDTELEFELRAHP